MQKYIVTVSVEGLESPITVRAENESQAVAQASSKGAKVIGVMTKESYKKKYKQERQTVSSIESNHKIARMSIK